MDDSPKEKEKGTLASQTEAPQQQKEEGYKSEDEVHKRVYQTRVFR
jgi:hypothetical protein